VGRIRRHEKGRAKKASVPCKGTAGGRECGERSGKVKRSLQVVFK
jgi:hypothetical protein